MLARALDGMAVFLIGGVVVGATNLARSRNEEQEGVAGGIAQAAPTVEVNWALVTPSLSWFVAFGVAMAIFVVYEVGFTGLFGATPGKLVMRLRVVDRRSRKLVNPGCLVFARWYGRRR